MQSMTRLSQISTCQFQPIPVKSRDTDAYAKRNVAERLAGNYFVDVTRHLRRLRRSGLIYGPAVTLMSSILTSLNRPPIKT